MKIHGLPATGAGKDGGVIIGENDITKTKFAKRSMKVSRIREKVVCYELLWMMGSDARRRIERTKREKEGATKARRRFTRRNR